MSTFTSVTHRHILMSSMQHSSNQSRQEGMTHDHGHTSDHLSDLHNLHNLQSCMQMTASAQQPAKVLLRCTACQMLAEVAHLKI